MEKILIVDDNRDILDFLELLLQLKKYKIKTATSNEELNNQLYNFDPDLVILDVMLNGEDGRVICKALKESYADLPVILLSANSSLLHDHKNWGADEAIEKPFNIDEITSTIKRVLWKKTG